MPKRSYAAVGSDNGDAARRRRLNSGNTSSRSSQSQSRRVSSTAYVPQTTNTNRPSLLGQNSSSSSQSSSGHRQLPWLTVSSTPPRSQSRPSTQRKRSTHTSRSNQSTQPTSSSYATPSSQHRPPAHVQAIHDTLNWLSTQPDIFESDDEPEVIDLTQADPGPVLEFYGYFGPYSSCFRHISAPHTNTRQMARSLAFDTTMAPLLPVKWSSSGGNPRTSMTPMPFAWTMFWVIR